MYATLQVHHQPIPIWLLCQAMHWQDSKICVRPKVHLKCWHLMLPGFRYFNFRYAICRPWSYYVLSIVIQNAPSFSSEHWYIVRKLTNEDSMFGSASLSITLVNFLKWALSSNCATSGLWGFHRPFRFSHSQTTTACPRGIVLLDQWLLIKGIWTVTKTIRMTTRKTK